MIANRVDLDDQGGQEVTQQYFYEYYIKDVLAYFFLVRPC